MGLFKKKDIYLVYWSFEENSSSRYTTVIKAVDAAHAALAICEQHALPIFIKEIEKLNK